MPDTRLTIIWDFEEMDSDLLESVFDAMRQIGRAKVVSVENINYLATDAEFSEGAFTTIRVNMPLP